MKIFNAIGVTLLLFSNHFGEEVTLSGKVTDLFGIQMSGVTVTLQGNGLSATTDASGQYLITGSTTLRNIAKPREDRSWKSFRFENDQAKFNLDARTHVSISVLNVSGRRVENIVNRFFEPGSYHLPIRSWNGKFEPFILHAESNGQSKDILVNDFFVQGQTSKPNTQSLSALAKSAAYEDTLVFWKAGFPSVTKPVTMMTETINVQLTPYSGKDRFAYIGTQQGTYTFIGSCLADGTDKRTVVVPLDKIGGSQIVDLDWSANGKRIAFSTPEGRSTTESNYAIYTMNADGSNLAFIGRGAQFRMHPDGNLLAWVHFVNSGTDTARISRGSLVVADIEKNLDIPMWSKTNASIMLGTTAKVAYYSNIHWLPGSIPSLVVQYVSDNSYSIKKLIKADGGAVGVGTVAAQVLPKSGAPLLLGVGFDGTIFYKKPLTDSVFSDYQILTDGPTAGDSGLLYKYTMGAGGLFSPNSMRVLQPTAVEADPWGNDIIPRPALPNNARVKSWFIAP